VLLLSRPQWRSAASCCACPAAGKYSLAGLLPAEQEKALFDFFDACALLWRKTIKRSDLLALEKQVSTSLYNLEMAFPCDIARIVMHNLAHMATKIGEVGPLCITSMFPYERHYRLLRAWISNQNKVEASLAKNIKANLMKTLYTASNSSHLDASIFNLQLVSADDEEQNTAMSSYISPYHALPNGNWEVETSQGRMRNVTLEVVPRVSAAGTVTREYATLHVYHYESNSAYRDAFNR
jgi:hypothetical protein